jgi:CBS domain-containing protein
MSEITLTVGPSHTLREAAQKMVEKGTGAALVFDDELPTPSVVTERDLLISIARGQDPDMERVADHMSEGVLTAAPDWSLERAAAPRRLRGARGDRRPLDARHRQGLDVGWSNLRNEPPRPGRVARLGLRGAGNRFHRQRRAARFLVAWAAVVVPDRAAGDAAEGQEDEDGADDRVDERREGEATREDPADQRHGAAGEEDRRP